MTRTPHSAYLSPSRTGEAFGQYELAQRRQAAKAGSENLRIAILLYLDKRRRAA